MSHEPDSPPPPYSAPPWRTLLLPLASVGYVVTLAVLVDRADGLHHAPASTGGLSAIAALVLAVVAARRRTSVGRWMGWGLAVVVASLGAGTASRGLDACGMVGAMACVLSASFALARIPWQGGLVQPQTSSPVPAAIVVTAAWWAALVARVVPSPAAEWMGKNPGDWALAAAVVSALILWGCIEWTFRRRGLELAVVERALAMRALLGIAFVATLISCVIAEAPPHECARLFVALASGGVVAVASAFDPVRAARITRRVVVLVTVGGAVALLGASAVGPGWGGSEVTFITAALALLIGAAAPVLEAPLRPSRGVWLDAFVRAAEVSSRGDPDEAIRAVLGALRAPTGPSSPSPELWTFPPARVVTVDAAGYLHEHDAELPERLSSVAASEPLSTLRLDLLDALVVRRPELRPIAKWMRDRGAVLATLVECDGEGDGAIEGVLVLTDASQESAARLTLEEVRALKAVADRLAPACRARATQARMLGRAQEALERAETAEAAAERLRSERAKETCRNVLAAMRLAAPAMVGLYSAASRMAFEAIERRTHLDASVAVLAPAGVDPIPYVARAHLSGARRQGPLVVVDGASAREHDLARWSDPNDSPLALAHRGLLVLLDGASFPLAVQNLVANALLQMRAPWDADEVLDVQLALTSVAPPDDLVARGRLLPSLASRLGDARSRPIALPRLRERADDLRSLLTDRLARDGLRVHGRPVGIEPAAYARLVDYAFPGEDAELVAVVQRLVLRCTGDVVRVADVEALRLRVELGSARRKDPLSV